MRRILLISVSLAAAPFAAPRQDPAAQQPPLIFRSAATLVPVDVRVIDKKGNPVTDLKREDFTLIEDGVPQRVHHFSPHTLRAAAAIAGPPGGVGVAGAGSPADSAADPAATIAAPDRRVFLIVLGRGRLQPPSKGVDAAIDFVRNRLLPQDEVAVIAFNRATDFTSDHGQIAAMLDRFRLQHEEIEAKLVHNFSFPGVDPAAIPAQLQSSIDAVFGDARGAGLRSIPTAVAETSQMARDLRDAEDRRRAEMLASPSEIIRAGGAVVAMTQSASDQRLAEISGMSFEQMLATTQMTMQDLGRIYSGLEYLRRLEGEKHLIYVAEHGLFLPSAESDASLAAIANDNRITIDIIQTGGLATMPGTALQDVGRGTPARSMTQLFAVQSMREVATLTGGQLSVYDYAAKAIDKIDRATTSEYLLGYYPANVNWDGRYRRVEIKVKRSGVTVLYRHGYYAKTPAVGFDRRRAVSYSRIAYAANLPATIRDIKFNGKLSIARGSGRAVQADLEIDLSRVKFTAESGLYVAALDIAVFCGDAFGGTAGETWETVDLKYTAEQLALAKQTGLTRGVRVPVKIDVKEVRDVRIVVYDVHGDRLGSAVMQMK